LLCKRAGAVDVRTAAAVASRAVTPTNQAASAVGRDLPTFLRATYSASLKSAVSDEWINTYAIRPLASVLVWVFYRMHWKPVWVVLLGVGVGSAAAAGVASGMAPWALSAGGALLLVKNLLDAADGQLARATDQVDRVGRFADALTDFWVNSAVALALAVPLSLQFGTPAAVGLALATGFSLVLQCSLFVFYQVSFLARRNHAAVNRTDERVRAEDANGSRLERRLQRAYLWCYGWQDALMAWIDRRLGASVPESRLDDWYGDLLGLRLSSFLGLGTTLTGVGVALLVGRADLAVLWSVGFGNAWALIALGYRAFVLAPRLRR